MIYIADLDHLRRNALVTKKYLKNVSVKDASLLVSVVGLVLLSSLSLLLLPSSSSFQIPSYQSSSSSPSLMSSVIVSDVVAPLDYFAILPPAFALTELQRITIDDASLVNALGASVVDNVNVNQQVNISSTMTNNQDITQKFVYIVQIQDDQGLVVSLSWIGGESAPAKTFTSSLSWTPDKLGQYTIDIFVWEDLINHNALSEKITLQINVS